MEDHVPEKCRSIPGLKAIFTGGQPKAEHLYTMGARRNFPWVGAGMAPEFSPHYFGIIHMHILILTLISSGSMGINISMGNLLNHGKKVGKGQLILHTPTSHLCSNIHLRIHLIQCLNFQVILFHRCLYLCPFDLLSFLLHLCPILTIIKQCK